MTAREADIARHLAWAVQHVQQCEHAGTYDRRRAEAELRFWMDREALEREQGLLDGHGVLPDRLHGHT